MQGLCRKEIERQKERKGKQFEKRSRDFEGTIEFNYLIETSKAFFSPLG